MDRPKRIPKALTKEQADKFLASFKNVRDQLVFELFYRTGLRASELINLTLDDVAKDLGSLNVRGGKSCKDRVAIIVGDGSWNERFSLWIKARKRGYTINTRNNSLVKLAKKTDLLFPTNRGTRIKASWLRVLAQEAGKAIGLPFKMSPSKLRHTHAVLLVENDVPLTAVQNQLGHSSPSTTAIYVHPAVGERRKMMEKVKL